ncbi:MAG: hypothetical protein K1060chlam2_00414 [Chlamydiae bacterium]|nr:hypothetical protein [Chlamydiota bacterium]
MKKNLLLLTLALFSFTAPLASGEPLAPTEDAPFRDRTEREHPSSTNKYKKALVVVIGTLAAITIGLIVSGSNSGKNAPSEDSTSS